jgi:putative phosphoribosyl transferase
MMASARLANRAQAGKALARKLSKVQITDPVVLALPRGGVPVAVEIARVLRAPLDLVLVRKIGVPFQPELAAAAVVNGDQPEVVVNDDVVATSGVTRAEIDEQARIELVEIERRRQLYLAGQARVALTGRSLILVDDGIATGASMRAAIAALKRKQPKALIVAVPVAPAETVVALRSVVDEVVCLKTPEPFYAIGLHYRDFHQLTDAEVMTLLRSTEDEVGSEGR